ncbi:MAG: hypothetical protein OEZ13_07245 [Spirochaetia bacterium]|nr:hypothetical protein [Spirochaetia bacterium]
MEKKAGRFSLLMHFYGRNHPENHLDLFLDIGENLPLAHYFCSLRDFRKQKKDCLAYYILRYGKPHRRRYLTYSGLISENRGKVRKLKKGKYKASFKLIQKPLRETIKIAFQR